MAMYDVELPNVKISGNTDGFRFVYDAHGNRTMNVLGITDEIFPEDIPEKCLNSKVILISPILQKVNLDLIRSLREKSHATLFLNPQDYPTNADEKSGIVKISGGDLAAELASLVDIIKLNELQSIALTGFEDPYTSVRLLLDWGAKIGIITLADKGSIIRRGRGYVVVPAYKTLAKDPTGAGDVYVGAFIKKYLEDKPLLECGFFASAAASIKVEYTGPDFPMTYEAATQRMRELIS